MPASAPTDIPFIYNLFPTLVGEVSRWYPHVERAADMGFNWIFLNPIHLTGASGSLYAIRDYFTFNPELFPQDDPKEQRRALRRFVNRCRDRGVEVMVDLVINHTAYDNPLTRHHRNWYKFNDDGSIKSPGAADDQAPGGYVTWGDLSEIDNENSPDKANLHEYWWTLVDFFLDLDVRGFRCDAAYQIPNHVWKMLIDRAKEKAPETRFFAESLGCPLEQTIGLADIGHDFVFNSGKWWDYRADWFPGQLNEMAGRASSICFPESHDTERLAAEVGGSVEQVRQHYLFTALISTGVLMLIGYEYGFHKKPHVVHTNPHDWEGAHYDLTDYIRRVNRLKASHPVFQEDNHVHPVDTGDDAVVAIQKISLDGQKSALLLFNRSDAKKSVPIKRILQKLKKPAAMEIAGYKTDRAAQTAELGPWGSSIALLTDEPQT